MNQSKDPLDDLVCGMVVVLDGQLLEGGERPNHRPSNPGGIPPLPVEFQSVLHIQVVELFVDSIIKSLYHGRPSTEYHALTHFYLEVFTASIKRGLNHALQGFLVAPSSEQNLGRPMDSGLTQMNDTTVGEFIAPLLLGPAIDCEFVIVVIGGFHILLFHFLDDVSLVKFIFALDWDFAEFSITYFISISSFRILVISCPPI